MSMDKLDELRDGFAERLEALAAKALRAPGGGEWGEVLREYGVEPVVRAGAAAAVACGFQPARGALPLELRKVFTAVRAAFGRKAAALREDLTARGAPANVLHRLGKLGRQLDNMLEERMSAYVEAIRPKATLGGIFANAAATSLRFKPAESGTTTLKCQCCGAARLEGTNMRECAFCGMPLFKDEETGDDHER